MLSNHSSNVQINEYTNFSSCPSQQELSPVNVFIFSAQEIAISSNKNFLMLRSVHNLKCENAFRKA